MAMRIVGLPLRGLEFVFTVIVMALVGNIIAQAFAGNPATINYAMFCAAFSMVSLFYLIPATWNDGLAGHPIIVIIVDLLNAIFFLTSGIALAARLQAHSCTNNNYLAHNEVTNGSLHHREKRCREAQATDAFLWFAWAAYTASLILSIINARSSTNLRPSRPNIRRPGMAQV
ncbi:hypothetical protein VTN96DRAFT_2182 [Rasamsonia emersonii]|uniref:Non-classical export protein Nce102 n=1 Tax=Rasamsonia emersonii (strain ATCC 16479 / CBS 393.64 / IMI 116815) TaxID=1408163 RepID=A0A0F4YJT4_RASE3|nr:Non-classical export protein Nce102 [Rasamsonia emersonii CBS 393.64]KKA18375.1 Non-classical export protein Nce102 [Rasamsonia emersonii CBS 393.64]